MQCEYADKSDDKTNFIHISFFPQTKSLSAVNSPSAHSHHTFQATVKISLVAVLYFQMKFLIFIKIVMWCVFSFFSQRLALWNSMFKSFSSTIELISSYQKKCNKMLYRMHSRKNHARLFIESSESTCSRQDIIEQYLRSFKNEQTFFQPFSSRVVAAHLRVWFVIKKNRKRHFLIIAQNYWLIHFQSLSKRNIFSRKFLIFLSFIV